MPSLPTRICVCTASGLSISQMCCPAKVAGIGAGGAWRHVELRPGAEIFFGGGESFLRRDVAGEGQQGLIRRVVRVVEFCENCRGSNFFTVSGVPSPGQP